MEYAAFVNRLNARLDELKWPAPYKESNHESVG